MIKRVKENLIEKIFFFGGIIGACIYVFEGFYSTVAVIALLIMSEFAELKNKEYWTVLTAFFFVWIETLIYLYDTNNHLYDYYVYSGFMNLAVVISVLKFNLFGSKLHFDVTVIEDFLFFVLIALSGVNINMEGSKLLFPLICFLLIKCNDNFKTDLCGFAVFGLTLANAISLFIRGWHNTAVQQLNMTSVFLAGYNYYAYFTDKKAFIKNTVFALFMGIGIYQLSIFIYNIINPPLTKRMLFNAWTGLPISVTIVGLLSAVAIPYSFYALFFKEDLLKKIFAFLIMAIATYFSIKTATRTFILLFSIVYTIMFILFFIRSSKKVKLNILLVLGLCLALVLFTLIFNPMEIKTKLFNTPLFKRLISSGFEDTRLKIAKKHFKYMFIYPFGQSKILSAVGQYAHNFIQDAHDFYGIFSFIFILIVTVFMLKNLVVLTIKNGKDEEDILFIGLYVSLLIQMCLEPIFHGYPLIFTYACLVHGIATRKIKEDKNYKTVFHGLKKAKKCNMKVVFYQ